LRGALYVSTQKVRPFQFRTRGEERRIKKVWECLW